jgi:hypothetical protein
MLPLVILLAVLLSALTYGWLEPAPGQRGMVALRRSAVPFGARSVAWAALGILLLDMSCAVPRPPGRPLVLLDASLSLGADSGRWSEARDSAQLWGEVLTFGDERTRVDSVPSRGRSQVGPALRAAAASDRPIIVVTDGEVEDVPDLPPDLVERAAVRLFPRRPGSDLAITAIEGPERVTAGDSVPLEITVSGYGPALPPAANLAITLGDRTLASRPFSPASGGTRFRMVLPSSALRPEANLLQVRLTGITDAEPKDDARLFIVTVTPTPGVVLLADPGDWDSRTLYRALVDVAQLPVRGYVQIEPGRWRSYSNLAPVSSEEVRRVARGADLLILKGNQADARATNARGLWLWPAEGNGITAIPGDWYVTSGGISPIAGAFTGLPVDSFPPAIQVMPIQPDSGGWIAVTAQNGRRGPERPVVMGKETGNRREVIIAADGLWRWAFRGGSSEQGYRSWVAATASWLLGGVDSITGKARPVRPVVANQRPIIFEWLAANRAGALEIVWTSETGTRRDTLRFDGAGRANAWLPPGSYRYRLEGGGSGVVAVEEYSDEWLPRSVALSEQAQGDVLASPVPSRARGWVWLFGLCVLGLAIEWLARRRLGFR